MARSDREGRGRLEEKVLALPMVVLGRQTTAPTNVEAKQTRVEMVVTEHDPACSQSIRA